MDTEILFRFLLAIVWGGIVGAEREYRGKPAGFRTMIMISIGACFFTIMSVYIGQAGSPDRIASNIVTGIGFIGAGVIFRGQGGVSGITTAATIWAVAAVGMGIGAGLYFAAGSASLCIFLVLAVLPYGEMLIDRTNLSREYCIGCSYSEGARHRLEQLMRTRRLRFKLIKYVKEGEQLSITWSARGSSNNHEEFERSILHDPAIDHFTF